MLENKPEFKGAPQDSGKVTPAHAILNLIRTHKVHDLLADVGEDIPEEFLEDADKILSDSMSKVPRSQLIDIIYDLTMFIADNPEVDETAVVRMINTSLFTKPDIFSDK